MRQVGKNNIEMVGLQYFGSVEFYSALKNKKDIYYHPESSFEKALHLNRTVINGANGPIPLSIPLLGGRNQKVFFKDVQIAEDGNWRRIHWRSIHDSYRKAPWFDEYGWQVEQLYKLPEKFLVDWNLKLTKWVIDVLALNVDILSEKDSASQLTYQDFSFLKFGENQPEDYPKYHQVFLGRQSFKANLSILDLIFCEGPQSVHYLQQLAAYKNLHSTSI